ncbi:MAG: hypothetical protein F4112_13545 [Holophagales bacterium]|nr:hypothetical protein [Holophagales bacterium]MYD20696.1 hypothetical protein [Holophagales bacterium]MYI33976.1 hypothetical protein [Holophagales bacterium]
MNALVSEVERLESVENARFHEGELLVVLTEDGWETLAHKGKEELIRELSDLLVSSTTAEQAQGRWRFVRRLPAAGKASRDCPLHPRWEELDRTAATWLGETEVPDDLAVLEGHFPDEPIVPGLAQLLWADTLSRRVFAGYAATTEVRNLKFARLVVPGLRLRLELVHEMRIRSRVAFSFTTGAGTHSSGVLIGP